MPAETVKVMVRVRPMNSREKGKNCLQCVEIDDKLNQISLQKAGNTDQKNFTYDYVFGQNVLQQTIYENTAFPLVENVVEGYNGTIFAYGQTGCGKTHTMIGDPANDMHKGIIPRTFDHIINVIQTEDKADKKYLVRCAYIEIYNEEVHDLLGKDVKARMEMKESPDVGVFIKDLTVNVVRSVAEMDKYMAIGNSSRSTGETAMNKDSSRSHSIFTIFIECSVSDDKGNSRITAGKLNLVDLAGSERQSKTQATGDRLKEATKINLSLSALGNVISALVDGKIQHIPYRDSKLTRLLQDSLGGNTKTIMIAAISPADDNYDETWSTLRYASRAKQIKNQPKVNEDPKDAQLREYAEEIKKLKDLLLKQQEIPSQFKLQIGEQPTIKIKNNNSQVDQIEKQKALETQKQLQNANTDLLKQKDKLEQEMKEREEQMKKEREEKARLETLIKEKEQLFMQGGYGNEEEKKKYKQLQNKIKLQKKEHDQLIAERQKNQEELLKMEENYKSVNDELDQLRKLVSYHKKKYYESLSDIKDLEKEAEETKEEYLETIRTQDKELKLMTGIIKMLLSNDEIDSVKGACIWNEENKEYLIPPFSFRNKKVYFPKLPGAQAMDLVEQDKNERQLVLDKEFQDGYDKEFRGSNFRFKNNDGKLNAKNEQVPKKGSQSYNPKYSDNEQSMMPKNYSIRSGMNGVNHVPTPPQEKRQQRVQLQPIQQENYAPGSPNQNKRIQSLSTYQGNGQTLEQTIEFQKYNKANVLLQPMEKPPIAPSNGGFDISPQLPNEGKKPPGRLAKINKVQS